MTRLLEIGLLCVLAQGNDDNVQWNGISHLPFLDRRPMCPTNGEAFSVYFQALRFDLTSARVRFNQGPGAWIDAVYNHDRGPYAVWRADLPATAPGAVFNYYVELTDGTDTDYYSAGGMSDNPPADGGFVIDYNTYSHAPIGATPTTGGTIFKVWAPTRTSAWVRGQFNGWSTANPMARHGAYFVALVPGAAAGQQYKYYFDPGAIWKPDARARRLNAADSYNSYIINPLAFTWTDQAYRTPAFEDMIVYELHVGTFSGRNDPVGSGSIPATFADVAAHVDHLVELGVNAVELTPMNEFPTDFSAGYNPITQFAPEWRYGTPDQFKAMVNTLHAHGIAVLMDIVWNHFSPSDNYLWFYDGTQIYFDNPAVETPWGSQADFDRPEVREYFIHSAMQWLDEYHVDGFRFDGTHYMDMYQGASGWGLMQSLNNIIDNRWIDKLSVAEQLPNDPWITRPTSLGGAGFDSQWHDAFTDNLRQEITDAAFGDPEMWRIANIINGSGQYLSNTYATNYFELHDEVWPSSGGQRMVRTIDTTFPHDDMWAKGRTKLAQGLVMFAPGIPAIIQGAEWLEDTNFGGGNSSGADRIDWSKKTTYARIFEYYRDIIAVRKSNGGFRSNAGHQVFHTNDAGNVIAFRRWDVSGNEVVVVANFSNTNYSSYRIGLPRDGLWYELINSQAAGYDGNAGFGGAGQTNCGAVNASAGPYDGLPHSAVIHLPQMGLLVFRWSQPPNDFLDADADGFADVCDNCPATPNPTQYDADNDGTGDACDPDACDPCDTNCDGSINGFDIQSFVDALTASPPPLCSPCAADTNGDGSVNGFDIQGFVECLGG